MAKIRISKTPPPRKGRFRAYVCASSDKPVYLQENKSNAKGPARDAWSEFGRPEVLSFLANVAIDLSSYTGWTIRVRDCHYRPTRAARDNLVRVTAEVPEQWRFVLRVVPWRGKYTFDVDLLVDTASYMGSWADMRALVAREVNALQRDVNDHADRGEQLKVPAFETADPEVDEDEEEPKEVAPVAKAPAVPTKAANPETILGGLAVKDLTNIRDGIDTLLDVGKDMDAALELKAAALAAVKRAKAEADPLEAKLSAADQLVADVAAKYEHAKLHRKVTAEQAAKAAADEERLAKELESAHERKQRAADALVPAALSLAEAERGLDQAEALEAEKQKALAAVGDVAVLLSALKKLGAKK